jgi:serine/threonine-protein kinase HipA
MAAERQAVEVCADWSGVPSPTPMGTLYAIPSRGREVFSFEYAADWLASDYAQVLDPALSLLPGPQYPAADKPSFGVFLDSSPDRWGRVLMQRREALVAREQGRAPRRLAELDYLLGVYDGHRMGGLRFRRGAGPFLDDDAELASPPWTSLRELEHASTQIDQPGAEDDPEYARWLRMLIAPGRSLGGARPKASVIDPQSHLWLAKFPSTGDVVDIGAWESIANTLARRAGIRTAETRHQRFGSRHHTFLSRRFDRAEDNARIHFASAMTLLDRNDGDAGSYLDLAEVIVQYGARPSEDLEELWRRIAFSVCISNIDDHLRNHGFVLEPHGWVLAPAYDLNPVATGDGLMLNISEIDNAQSLDLVREVARQFRIKQARATEIIATVIEAVRTWRAEAARFGVARGEQEQMAPAFRVADAT